MFKRSRHIKLSTFIISQDCFELPRRTTQANGNMYHIFKPNNIRIVYQNECSKSLSRQSDNRYDT